MASWSGAITAVINRLETHTPERDPQVKYTPAPFVEGVRVDRHFRIETPASLERGSVSDGDPVVGEFVLMVVYTHRSRTMELLMDMGDDAEDLIQRIVFFPGSEWAAVDGYGFWIEDPVAMEQDTDGGALAIPVKFKYNMR